MRGQVPCLQGPSHADVAADLSHPHRLALELQGRQPQPHVVPLVDGLPRLLTGDILEPAEHVERADRRVAVGGSEDERLQRPPRGAEVHHLGWTPFPAEEGREQVILLADHHDVERIAVGTPAGVGGEARQCLQRRTQLGIALQPDDRLRRIVSRPVLAAEVGLEARHPQEVGEAPRRAAPRSHEVDRDGLRALVQVGEDEPGARGPGQDGAPELDLVEERVHLTIRRAGEDGVPDVRGLPGGEVVGVEPGGEQPVRRRLVVLHRDPHRLDAACREVGAEECPCFAGAEHRDRHLDPILPLGDRAVGERDVLEPAVAIPCERDDIDGVDRVEERVKAAAAAPAQHREAHDQPYRQQQDVAHRHGLPRPARRASRERRRSGGGLDSSQSDGVGPGRAEAIAPVLTRLGSGESRSS